MFPSNLVLINFMLIMSEFDSFLYRGPLHCVQKVRQISSEDNFAEHKHVS